MVLDWKKLVVPFVLVGVAGSLGASVGKVLVFAFRAGRCCFCGDVFGAILISSIIKKKNINLEI